MPSSCCPSASATSSAGGSTASKRSDPAGGGSSSWGSGIQFIPLPDGVTGNDLVIRTAALALSYSLLLAFGLVNVRMPGMLLVVIGLACNMIVIVVNGGMPASAQTLIDSGQEDVLAYLRDQGADKHHLLTDDDQLTFLADVIAVPQPIGQAVSVGDIFVYAGLTWLIVAAMRGWTPSARPAGSGPRRGKHRRGQSGRLRLSLTLDFFLLEPRRGEPDRDRRALSGDALDREGAATDGRTLAHHRHPVVPLGGRRLDVEPDSVVTQGHLDLVALSARRRPRCSMPSHA